MKRIVLLVMFLNCLFGFTNGQIANQDLDEMKDYEPKQMLEVNAQYTLMLPQRDLGDRFGAFSGLGIGLTYKFFNNITVTGRISTLFGSRVAEIGLLDSMRGSSGELIDVNGNYTQIAFMMRGTQTDLMLGKIIRTGKNPNNGIWLQAGYSIMRHRIHFQYQQDIFPQLDNEMYKGYDRFSGGGGPLASIGYHHISANKTVSYFVNWQYGFYTTQSLRGFNFDTRMPDLEKRQDWVQSINMGIILPIRPQVKNKENLYN